MDPTIDQRVCRGSETGKNIKATYLLPKVAELELKFFLSLLFHVFFFFLLRHVFHHIVKHYSLKKSLGVMGDTAVLGQGCTDLRRLGDHHVTRDHCALVTD